MLSAIHPRAIALYLLGALIGIGALSLLGVEVHVIPGLVAGIVGGVTYNVLVARRAARGRNGR
jgi:hypothetical protein